MPVGERDEIVGARSCVRPPGPDHGGGGRAIEAQRVAVDLADSIGMAEAVDRERNVRACDEHDPQLRWSAPDQRLDHPDRPDQRHRHAPCRRSRSSSVGGGWSARASAISAPNCSARSTGSAPTPGPADAPNAMASSVGISGQPDPELSDQASGELEAVALVATCQPHPRQIVGPRSHGLRLAAPGRGRHDGERSGRRARFGHHPVQQLRGDSPHRADAGRDPCRNRGRAGRGCGRASPAARTGSAARARGRARSAPRHRSGRRSSCRSRRRGCRPRR